jgi:ubiquinone/menaquinone biosynthesis C-methylase UbiE
MKRQPTAELLDTDSGTPDEIAASLADLRGINRRFGGVATSEAMVRSVIQELGSTSLSLLEVAAGSGYVPETIRQHLEQRGFHLEVTLLDRAPSHLKQGGSSDNGVKAVAADALALPFRDDSFDLVSCTLFTHHLSPQQVVAFVNEALRVCRSAVLINDLVRHSLHLALVYAALPIFRSPITRHDSLASVRQSYTVEEMRALLQKTTAARVQIHGHFLFRMGLIAWKK